MLDAPDLPQRPRRLRRVAVPALVAAVVAAILVVLAVATRTTASQRPATAAVASAAATSGPPTLVPPVPARPVLLALADRLVDGPADTAPGAYAYIETRSWANVLTGPLGNRTSVQVVRYQQLWQDGHGTGRMTVLVETSGCALDGSSGSWSGTRQPEFFGPPAVTDPVKLRQQLLAGSGPGTPGSEGTSITGGVAGTAEQQTIPFDGLSSGSGIGEAM